jgi:hypothetical protein
MGKKEATTLCYIKDADYAWVPAVLSKTEGDKAYVQVPQYKDEQAIMSDGGRGAKREPVEKIVNLKDYAHKVLPLQNVDKNGCLTEHADMVKLPYLHEVRFASLLREAKNPLNIDTFSASPIIPKRDAWLLVHFLAIYTGCHSVQHEEASY